MFVIVLQLFVGLSVYATTPFSAKIFCDDPYCFAVGFPWPDQNDSVLMIRNMSTTHNYSLNDLGIDIRHTTTAGYDWYENAIGMLMEVRVRTTNSMPWMRIFYFRNMDGKEILINTHTGQYIDKKSIILDRHMYQRNLESHIMSLLSSPKPRDRQTGAIHAGISQLTNGLPILRGLIHDKSYTIHINQGEAKQIYFVKEAAEEAIRVITERKSENDNSSNKGVQAIGDKSPQPDP